MGSILEDYQDRFSTQKDLATALACGFLSPGADLLSAVQFLQNMWNSDRYDLEQEMFVRDRETGKRHLLHCLLALLFEPADDLTRVRDLADFRDLLPPVYAYADRLVSPVIRKRRPTGVEEDDKK